QTLQASAAQCSIARLSIVTGLADTTATVNNISTSDPAVASAVSTAQGGLSAALTAIDTIVQALQAGVAPPADARDQVGTGLGEALAALNSINSTDAGITAAVANAQTQLNDTITAGQQVVDDCGSGRRQHRRVLLRPPPLHLPLHFLLRLPLHFPPRPQLHLAPAPTRHATPRASTL
ncbi:hypothetical protein BD779DRAFT_1638505, partial [Infundibulicybe gibba]